MDLLAHLEAYVAVAEERSFSKAADRLYVAQPVLSRRIKTLEQHLGGELFDRSRRQITSTELGVLLLPHAKDVLSRIDHLRTVVTAARSSTAQTLGVPPDADPACLARIIRAGTDSSVTIRVEELPAHERASQLADGLLAFALVRVPPETAAHRVPLGLASVLPMSRPVHLENLRPRRGAAAESAPVILITAEDQVGFAAERFEKATARAGLPATRVRPVGSTAAAAAETLAGHAVLLCTEPFARRHDLAWSALADATLHRGYEIGHHSTPAPDWMEPLLAEAIGAVAGPLAAQRQFHVPDPRTRLAAQG